MVVTQEPCQTLGTATAKMTAWLPTLGRDGNGSPDDLLHFVNWIRQSHIWNQAGAEPAEVDLGQHTDTTWTPTSPDTSWLMSGTDVVVGTRLRAPAAAARLLTDPVRVAG